MSLIERARKNSTISSTSVLDKSSFFEEKDMVPTKVPVLNIALSGDLEGGLAPGLTTFAGPSKHFKTAFSLLCAKAYLDHHEDSMILFYDSEFGTPREYFRSFGIDTKRVLHTPITDIEELKHDIAKQLKSINRGDRVIIIVDSIGNLASRKEVEDAEEGKSVADMTRAKALKGLFRLVTPHLTIKDIPMIVVNHTYKTIEMYSKDVVGGGTGSYYSSDNIYIIGRQQEKEGKDVAGYNFIIRVEKSRYVREGSKIPVLVMFEGGINKYSGLLDIAVDGGFIVKPSKGWYAMVDTETGEVDDKKFRAKETFSGEFWKPILANPKFKEFVRNRYQISHNDIITDDEIDEFTNGEE